MGELSPALVFALISQYRSCYDLAYDLLSWDDEAKYFKFQSHMQKWWETAQAGCEPARADAVSLFLGLDFDPNIDALGDVYLW